MSHVRASAALGFVLMSAALAAPPPARAAGQMPVACAALLAKARAAAGGTAWRGVVRLTAQGRATESSLPGSGTLDADLVRGRHAERFDLAVVGKIATVYDGTTVWQQDFSGGVHPIDSAFARALAVTDAYIARRGYLAANDTTAKTCYAESERGHDTVVVHVVPRGGRPADLAFDAATMLLARVREVLPTTVGVTSYDDYRTSGGLVLPYHVASGTAFEPANGYDVHVRRYVAARTVQDGAFARPVPTDVARMLGGVASTTVPARIEAQQLLVFAAIDGHAPMPFILDTGGHAILTAAAARALGLHGYGSGVSGGSGSGTIGLQFTKVRTLRLGAAELRDQPFLIIPYPYAFYERGRKQPIAGILGLEIFERFATRIDYGAGTITLAPLQTFRYRGNGAPVAMTFTEDMPLVDAAADGYSGSFGVDTGNSGGLILFGRFLREHGFAARYAGGPGVFGLGTGGRNSGTLHTLRAFTLGGRTLHDLRNTYFTAMTTGAFSASTEAGNIGFLVLSRFIPTFDYATQTLSLEWSDHAPRMVPNEAGFAALKSGPAALSVVFVLPKSPAAAAGIVAGDGILFVNGIAARELSGADLYDLERAPKGTLLRLRLKHGAAERDVVLRLR
jgi:hypothetical protein